LYGVDVIEERRHVEALDDKRALSRIGFLRRRLVERRRDPLALVAPWVVRRAGTRI
jgi:hypothetical protein